MLPGQKERTLLRHIFLLLLALGLVLSLASGCGSNRVDSDDDDDDDSAADDDDDDPILDPEGNAPGECNDGVDNDADGLTDCDDPGCEDAPACTGDDDDSVADDDDDDSAAGDDDDDDSAAGDDDDSASPVLFLVGEPNDTQATAYDLGGIYPVADLTFESALGTVFNSDPADWWKFTMLGVNATCFDLDVGSLASSFYDSGVEVYLPNGTIIATDTFNSSSNAVLQDLSGSAVGVYFLRILPPSIVTAATPPSYVVDIDVKPMFACP